MNVTACPSQTEVVPEMVSEGVNAEVTSIPILLDVTTEDEAQAIFDVSTQVMVSFVAKVVDV